MRTVIFSDSDGVESRREQITDDEPLAPVRLEGAVKYVLAGETPDGKVRYIRLSQD
jgi:hypothetical protein